MRAARRGRPPVHPQGNPVRRGPRLLRGRNQPFKVEILDDLAARVEGDRRAAAADVHVPARAVHRPVQGPSRGEHRQDRPIQADDRRRRVLARLREAADAAAHLRHGLVDPGRARRATCTGARRRSAATIAGSASQLDLFSFHDVSPGSAFWHPKGQRLWRTLETAIREVQDRRGYQEISTPMLVHKKLWEQSGHWANYQDNMFLLESEGQTFSLKPMNCPESTFIYKSKLRSYRDLPLRFSEFGRLHRNERSGTLSGLTRVRHFIQDDAHIYLRPDQLQDEIKALLGEVYEVYGWFGLEPRFTFGTKPDKALGDPALWETRGGADQGGAGFAGQALPPQAQGRRLLRAQDRHPDRGCARPRVADRHHPGGPGDAA